MDIRQVNARVIEQFRAGGEIEGMHRDRLLLLTTTGARTGQSRTTPMMFHRDGDRLLVIASNIGAPQHPDWYLNLRANSLVLVEIGDQRFDAIATTLEGSERERLWTMLKQNYSFFAEHQAKTSRAIPVVAGEGSTSRPGARRNCEEGAAVVSESVRARLDAFQKLTPASYPLVVSFSVYRDGPGDQRLEIVATNSSESARLVMQFSGIRELTVDWPQWDEVQLDVLEIIDASDRRWEDIQYRVYEGTGFFTFWCRDFTASLEGRTENEI